MPSGGRIGIFANDDAPQEITGTDYGDFMFDASSGGQAQTFHGGDGADSILGNDGGDTLDGGAGDDTLDGGTGTNTATFTGTLAVGDITYDTVDDEWTVDASAGTEGTDMLTGVEIVESTDGSILLVGPTAGLHHDPGCHRRGRGGRHHPHRRRHIRRERRRRRRRPDHHRPWRGDHPGHLRDRQLRHRRPVGMDQDALLLRRAGAGIEIAADGVTVSNVNIDGFLHGVLFNTDVTNTALTDIDINDTVIGIEKSTTANIDGLTLTDGSFTDGYIGIDFAKATGAGQEEESLAENVPIDGTHFEDMTAKGIYVEALSHSTITGVTMTNVGFWSSGRPSAAPMPASASSST